MNSVRSICAFIYISLTIAKSLRYWSLGYITVSFADRRKPRGLDYLASQWKEYLHSLLAEVEICNLAGLHPGLQCMDPMFRMSNYLHLRVHDLRNGRKKVRAGNDEELQGLKVSVSSRSVSISAQIWAFSSVTSNGAQHSAITTRSPDPSPLPRTR